MSNLVRFLVSLSFLLVSFGAFASVVDPGESRNRLQIVQSEPASVVPEESPFSVPTNLEPSRNLLQFDLILQPGADGSVSFQFEPLVVISLPRQSGLAGEFFGNPGVLYYYNARFYDPTLGRFITEDPARSGGNWSIYALANPLRYVDPTGLEDVGVSGANGELTKKTFQDNAFNRKAPAQPKESLQQPIGTMSKGNGVHTPNMGAMDFIAMGNESWAKDGFGSGSFGSESWSDVAGRDVSPGEKRSAALVAGLFDIATLGLGSKASPGATPSGGAQYVFDAKAGQYRDLTNGQFVSPKNLPWPGNSGFSGKPVDTPLTPGLMLDRLGSLKGEFAGLPGASASERGLPAGSEGRPYTQLQVLKPLTVPSGPAAPVPAFGASGGATQFQFSGGIQQWIDSGHLGVTP